MARERKLDLVGPIAFTSNGTDGGLVTVSSTSKFKVNAKVVVTADTLPILQLNVLQVISKTQMIIGDFTKGRENKADLSLYTTTLNASIFQSEQDRPTVPKADQDRATYEQEPTLARRVIMVDEFGNFYTTDNPFKVQLTDGSVNIGTVNAELEVQLSHKDNVPNAGDKADSVQVGDEATIAKVDPKNRSWSMNRYEKLLALLANANWMKLGDFDSIIPTFTEDNAVLAYKQNGAIIGKAFFRFVNDSDWDITLERYINNSNGDILLDDDNEELFLD